MNSRKENVRKALEAELGSEPWIVEGAVEFLKKYLKPDQVVLEFGGGGSTIFFAERVRKVVCIETDLIWARKIKNALLDRAFLNAKVTLILDPGRKYRLNPETRYNVIFLDGRDRVRAFKSSIRQLQEGGILILDNSERDRYRDIIHRLRGWSRADWEKRIDRKTLWRTSIFFKPGGGDGDPRR